jgi:hypothetical protein
MTAISIQNLHKSFPALDELAILLSKYLSKSRVSTERSAKG